MSSYPNMISRMKLRSIIAQNLCSSKMSQLYPFTRVHFFITSSQPVKKCTSNHLCQPPVYLLTSVLGKQKGEGQWVRNQVWEQQTFVWKVSCCGNDYSPFSFQSKKKTNPPKKTIKNLSPDNSSSNPKKVRPLSLHSPKNTGAWPEEKSFSNGLCQVSDGS